MDSFLSEFKNNTRSRFEMSEPFSVEPKSLKKASEMVRSKFEDGELTPQVNLNSLQRKAWFILQDEDRQLEEFSQKEAKYLAHIAYLGDKKKLIEQEDFWNFIERQLENTTRSSEISKWVHVYLRYEGEGIQHSKELGKKLYELIEQYEGQSSRVKSWKEDKELLFESGKSGAVGKKLLEQAQTVSEFLKSLRLSTELRESQFVERIIKQMIDTAAQKYPRFLRQALDSLKVQKEDGSTENRSKDLVRYAATKILREAGVDCEKKRKELIRNEIIHHLGDPRATHNRANWTGVAEESRRVFQQWLSQRDIEFFFEVVSKTEEQISSQTHWRYRKKFWEAYLPFIENTWVVMGSKAKQMAKLLFADDLDKLKYGRLKNANSRQSVFFLRIKGYDIVEYSHQGASRIWRVEESPLEFRQRSISVHKFRRDDTTNIKRFVHRMSERYRWQNKIAGWIRRNIGIEPTKSYRL
jgi:hypothetical protein